MPWIRRPYDLQSCSGAFWSSRCSRNKGTVVLAHHRMSPRWVQADCRLCTFEFCHAKWTWAMDSLPFCDYPGHLASWKCTGEYIKRKMFYHYYLKIGKSPDVAENDKVFTVSMVTVQVWITQPKYDVFEFGGSHVSWPKVVQPWWSVDHIFHHVDETLAVINTVWVAHVIVERVTDEEKRGLGWSNWSLQEVRGDG